MTPSTQLRKEILAARNQLNSNEISLKSAVITDKILQLAEITQSEAIFVYVSFRSEVETLPLIDQLIARGKTVCVPITRVKVRRLDAIRITDPASELVPGYCGIPEPKEEITASRQVDPAEIDAVLLPGSVFDERGGRFGYGGGFYDRFVCRIPRAHRIGMAFELQVVDKAPLQPHDELLDLIVTEERVIRTKRRS